eukprot:EC795499.1.p2 GENE.EC795499.1~~EC795499.1.p2  ORF type:complete len:161 (+),score=60.16 EC795499.1:53-535(+)
MIDFMHSEQRSASSSTTLSITRTTTTTTTTTTTAAAPSAAAALSSSSSSIITTTTIVTAPLASPVPVRPTPSTVRAPLTLVTQQRASDMVNPFLHPRDSPPVIVCTPSPATPIGPSGDEVHLSGVASALSGAGAVASGVSGGHVDADDAESEVETFVFEM